MQTPWLLQQLAVYCAGGLWKPSTSSEGSRWVHVYTAGGKRSYYSSDQWSGYQCPKGSRFQLSTRLSSKVSARTWTPISSGLLFAAGDWRQRFEHRPIADELVAVNVPSNFLTSVCAYNFCCETLLPELIWIWNDVHGICAKHNHIWIGGIYARSKFSSVRS